MFRRRDPIVRSILSVGLIAGTASIQLLIDTPNEAYADSTNALQGLLATPSPLASVTNGRLGLSRQLNAGDSASRQGRLETSRAVEKEQAQAKASTSPSPSYSPPGIASSSAQPVATIAPASPSPTSDQPSPSSSDTSFDGSNIIVSGPGIGGTLLEPTPWQVVPTSEPSSWPNDNVITIVLPSAVATLPENSPIPIVLATLPLPSPTSSPSASLSPALVTLWTKTLSPRLATPHWTDSTAYDQGHMVMVPMHAAFYLKREEWLDQIAQQFSSFTAEMVKPVAQQKNPLATNPINRLQFLYLASEFIVLAEKNGREDLVPAGLLEFISQELDAQWNQDPAWMWQHADFQGMRARLEWKLTTKPTLRSYYRAIFDEEIFCIGIAANLRQIESLTSHATQQSSTVTDVLGYAKRVFTNEVERHADGSWLLQPGAWADHPDYAYAGQTVKKTGLAKLPVPNIAWDSSHSLRFPRILSSLVDANKGTPDEGFYQGLLTGLETQFFDHVVVAPSADFPGYRTTNYMDGTNGLYRWGYASFGPDNGYGPYELSDSLFTPWWIFLGSQRAHSLYRSLADAFPMATSTVNAYIGPMSAAHAAYYNGGINELEARLAALLP